MAFFLYVRKLIKYFYSKLFNFIVLTLFAGLMSGLTVGYLSIDDLVLELKSINGNDDEKHDAELVEPILKHKHWLLVTLLICNAGAMEALPLCLNRIMSEFLAVILSVSLVLFFGEIIPQAVCTGPNQIKIAAILSPLTRLLMYVTLPISYPLGMLLDILLGKHTKSRFMNSDLKSLIELHTFSALGKLKRELKEKKNNANNNKHHIAHVKKPNRSALNTFPTKSTSLNQSKSDSPNKKTTIKAVNSPTEEIIINKNIIKDPKLIANTAYVNTIEDSNSNNKVNVKQNYSNPNFPTINKSDALDNSNINLDKNTSIISKENYFNKDQSINENSNYIDNEENYLVDKEDNRSIKDSNKSHKDTRIQSNNQSIYDSDYYGLDEDQAMMILSAIDLKNIRSEEEMIPIEKTEMINYDMSLKEFKEKLAGIRYSRLPVYQNNDKNDIIGVLRIKQLIGKDFSSNKTIRDLDIDISWPLLIHPDCKLHVLLKKFQEGKSHMAFVTTEVDSFKNKLNMYEMSTIQEFPKLLGIITLEDVLEKILQKEIYDEDDYEILNRHLVKEKKIKNRRSRRATTMKSKTDQSFFRKSSKSFSKNVITEHVKLINNLIQDTIKSKEQKESLYSSMNLRLRDNGSENNSNLGNSFISFNTNVERTRKKKSTSVYKKRQMQTVNNNNYDMYSYGEDKSANEEFSTSMDKSALIPRSHLGLKPIKKRHTDTFLLGKFFNNKNKSIKADQKNDDYDTELSIPLLDSNNK